MFLLEQLCVLCSISCTAATNNLHRHHSSSGLSGESTSTFERVASREAPFPPVPESDSRPPDPIANGHQFVSADARRTSAESQRRSPPTIYRRQQLPGQRSPVSITSYNLRAAAMSCWLLTWLSKSLTRSAFQVNQCASYGFNAPLAKTMLRFHSTMVLKAALLHGRMVCCR